MNWQSVLVFCQLVGSCLSQITFGFNPTSCPVQGQVVSFSGCNAFASLGQSCRSILTVSGTVAFQQCFCQQQYLNNIYEYHTLLQCRLSTNARSCANEERLCVGNGDLDFVAETGASSWLSYCGTALTYSLTTPTLSTVTVHFDPRCTTAVPSACLSGSEAIDSCHSAASGLGLAPASIVKCLCQEPVLEAVFTCEYVGNVTCSRTAVTTSNMLGYGVCPTYSQFLSSMLSSVRCILVPSVVPDH
jgi:hypothetical protein